MVKVIIVIDCLHMALLGESVASMYAICDSRGLLKKQEIHRSFDYSHHVFSRYSCLHLTTRNRRPAPGAPRECLHLPSRADSATRISIAYNVGGSRVANAYRVWGIRGLNTLTLEEESDRVHSLALSLAEGRHKLVQLGRALDLEEDLIVVVGNLDVQVLDGGRGILTASRRASVLVFARHFVTIADKVKVSNGTRLSWVVWTLEGSTEVD